MDFGESDDEELPTHIDSTTDSIEADANTASTFRSSELTDRSVPVTEPSSPGTARKRANEEIYEKAQRPLPSTTPLKTPPRPSFDESVSTESKGSSLFKVTFTNIQTPRSAGLSEPMEAATSDQQSAEKEPIVASNTFVEDIVTYQKQLEEEFKQYENTLKSRDRSQELAQLDWQELEDQYQKEIRNKVADEQMIMEDFETHFAQFMLWMRLSGNRESERAIKRLRTRVAFVQNSESQLGNRQQHYGKVLAAFQNAMALLGNA